MPAKINTASVPDVAPLPNHLYNRGLLSGKHSDITIHAFGTKYALHRLLLDRAPFFSSALSEPWTESSAKEITLHPEDIDSNITQAAFELALKRIYGCHEVTEEDGEAIGLFATGCWLDMTDLIEASINSLLRQMCPSKLSSYIRFVTSNYYGKHGDRILIAAKAMVCREGYEMLIRYFDGISGEIIREIIGSDGFYVPGEWERWILATRILNRRLKAKAIDAGLMSSEGPLQSSRPASMNFMAVRFDAVYRSTAGLNSMGTSGDADKWLGLYTCQDIAPILVLLDEGIHYMHLSFEQLQHIRERRDVLGVPLIPDKVISNALWMSMELRQRIVNSKESDLELGISQQAEDTEVDGTESPSSGDDTPSKSAHELSERAAGKQAARGDAEDEKEEDEMESGSWDGNGQPRKFWIPQVDSTYPMGGSLEPQATAANAAVSTRPTSRNRNNPRLSASLTPQDVQWATDFASSMQERPDTPSGPRHATTPSPQITFTNYPPFRFAAEFPPIRSLKEKKRVYSNTVFYAGSLWNVYIQKKETDKGTEVGIYLHRQRHLEGSDDALAHNSVDERIGHLERELLVRRHGNRRTATDPRAYASDDTNGSGNDTTLVAGPSQDLDTLSGLLRSQGVGNPTKASEASVALLGGGNGATLDRAYAASPSEAHKVDSDADDVVDGANQPRRVRVPALSPYVDGRSKIKTYFRIYAPSKGSRALSVYECAPDKFDFSQSWGWRSKELILEDRMEEERVKDPRLRFMVVIGECRRGVMND